MIGRKYEFDLIVEKIFLIKLLRIMYVIICYLLKYFFSNIPNIRNFFLILIIKFYFQELVTIYAKKAKIRVKIRKLK